MRRLKLQEKVEHVYREARERAQVRRLEYLHNGVWITGTGQGVRLAEMEDGHLANILHMYLQERSPFNDHWRHELVKPLADEALRRMGVTKSGVDRFELIELD